MKKGCRPWESLCIVYLWGGSEGRKSYVQMYKFTCMILKPSVNGAACIAWSLTCVYAAFCSIDVLQYLVQCVESSYKSMRRKVKSK